MKILHTSDLHLGKIVNEVSLIKDQEHILEEIIKIIKTNNVEAVIIAGDIYDRSVPPKEAVNLLDEFLKQLIININIPVLMISGNHDGGARLNFASSLLEKSGLYIAGSENEIYKKVSIKNNDFYLIPFKDPFIIKKMYDESIKDYNSAMNYVINQINNELDKTKVNVAIAHGYVANIGTEFKSYNELGLEITDSERPISIGGTDIIDAKLFNDFDYVALGHLHGRQKVFEDKLKYSGSPLKYSFSEVNQTKGVYIVDLDTNDYEFVNLKPIRNMRIIEGNLEEVLNAGRSDVNNYDYVQIILTDNGEILQPMDKIRTVYPNAMSVMKKSQLLENTEEIILSSGSEKSIEEMFEEYFKNYRKNYTEDHKKYINEIINIYNEEQNNETY